MLVALALCHLFLIIIIIIIIIIITPVNIRINFIQSETRVLDYNFAVHSIRVSSIFV